MTRLLTCAAVGLLSGACIDFQADRHACDDIGKCIAPGTGDAGAQDAGPPDGGGSDAGADAGFFILPLDAGLCSSDGWCFEHPLPVGNDFRAAFSDGQALWVAGMGGTLLRIQGATWAPYLPLDVGTSFYAMYGGADGIWALDTGTDCFHFDPSGTRLQPSTFAAPSSPQAMWGADGTYFAVGGGAVLVTDGGDWSQAFSTPFGLLAVHGSSPSDVWAVGEFASYAHFTADAGWVTGSISSQTDNLWSVHVLDDGSVVAGSVNSDLFVLGDGGWGQVTTLNGPVTDLVGRSLTDFYAADQLALYHCNQNLVPVCSAVWEGLPSLDYGAFMRMARINDSTIAAVGQSGLLVIGSGTQWTRVSGSDAPWLYALSRTPSGALLAVGEDQTVMRRSGSSWNLVAQSDAGSGRLLGVAAIDDASAWLVGEAGLLLWRADAGLSPAAWTLSDGGVPPPTQLNAVAVTGDAGAYSVGQGGVVLRWDGTAWRSLRDPDPSSADLRALWVDPRGQGWIAAGDGGTLVFSDGGGVVLPSSLDSGYLVFDGLWGSSSGDLWVVGTEIDSNNPNAPTGVGFHFDGGGWSRELSAGSEWTGVSGSAPNDVWTVGPYGAAMHYDGTLWTTSNTGTGQNLNAVLATSGKVWAAGVQGVLMSH